jgi:uncharacterized protein
MLATIDRVAAHGGAGRQIEDYAEKMFDSWGLARSSRNDGILILVARDDREMRIELGSGYGRAWNTAAQQVIDSSFLPGFQEDQYAFGIETGVKATVDQIARSFAAGRPAPSMPNSGWEVAVVFGAFVFLGGLGVIAARCWDQIASAITRLKRCPYCHTRGLNRSQGVIVAATREATGQSNTHIRCRNCGWHSVSVVTTPRDVPDTWSDSDSGGSSGGGASGRW